jgi:hypothetical protein
VTGFKLTKGPARRHSRGHAEPGYAALQRWFDADAPALHPSTSPEAIRARHRRIVRAAAKVVSPIPELVANVVCLPVSVVEKHLQEIARCPKPSVRTAPGRSP